MSKVTAMSVPSQSFQQNATASVFTVPAILNGKLLLFNILYSEVLLHHIVYPASLVDLIKCTQSNMGIQTEGKCTLRNTTRPKRVIGNHWK